MRQIINGKKYDTDAPGVECLARDSVGYASDFHHWEEGLYRTAKGAHFIAGKGGPASKYAQQGPGKNEWHGGCGIRVLTEAEARAWMESHGTTDEYEAAFDAEDA